MHAETLIVHSSLSGNIQNFYKLITPKLLHRLKAIIYASLLTYSWTFQALDIVSYCNPQ